MYLLSVIYLITAFGSTVSDLAKIRTAPHRIVGGEEATKNEFPWMVNLLNTKNGVFCAGTIIDEDWILTVAHCFDPSENTTIKITAGDHDLNIEESTEQIRYSTEVIIHPTYEFTGSDIQDDIALLKLNNSFIFNEVVQPINFLDAPDFPTGTVTVIGWGLTSENEFQLSNVLLKVNMTIVSQENCSRVYPINITEKMLCAGDPDKDSCNGDSGGPLLCETTDGESIAVCGIVSFGIGCARQGVPGVYTKVNSYSEWIKRRTGIADSSPFGTATNIFPYLLYSMLGVLLNLVN